jgi:hypothetical protein
LTEGHQSAPEFKFGIRFIKNMKYSDLWTKTEEELKIWQAALSRVCIQSDFHTKFSALKMIGRGSFARVPTINERCIWWNTKPINPSLLSRHSAKSTYSAREKVVIP